MIINILPITTPERRHTPREKNISNGSHPPHIRGGAGELAVHHLRAHELQRATHRHLHPVQPRRQPLREAKVNNSQVVIVVRIGEHDVERFQIKMNDILAVNVLYSSNNLERKQLFLIEH